MTKAHGLSFSYEKMDRQVGLVYNKSWFFIILEMVQTHPLELLFLDQIVFLRTVDTAKNIDLNVLSQTKH